MKHILITGATSGIGLALAELASSRGYKITACGRNQQKLTELQQRLGLHTLTFDVCDKHATLAALKNSNADIYVLNAGTCEYINQGKLDSALFERVFDANFFGQVHCLEAIQANLESGQQVLLVDSLARLLPFSRAQAYGASKASLHYLCKSLEVDWAKRGIVLQSISPGFVQTPLTDSNDFDMPMRISAKHAAQRILHGIERGKSSIYFPTRFSLLMRSLATLPSSWQVALCKSMIKGQSA